MRTLLTKKLEIQNYEVKAQRHLLPEDDPAALNLEDVQSVSVEFPKYTDGRGYSHAKQLRIDLAYKGALYAVGDVGVDEVRHLFEVGFDGVLLRDNADAEVAIKNVKRFEHSYQAEAYS